MPYREQLGWIQRETRGSECLVPGREQPGAVSLKAFAESIQKCCNICHIFRKINQPLVIADLPVRKTVARIYRVKRRSTKAETRRHLRGRTSFFSLTIF